MNVEMKVIRQILLVSLFFTFFLVEGFAQVSIPSNPIPLSSTLLYESMYESNPTTVFPPSPLGETPRPNLNKKISKWSDFTYNSPEEKVFWDKLPDWSESRLIGINADDWSERRPLVIPRRIGIPNRNTDMWYYKKRNALGERIEHNSTEGFSGYVKKKSRFTIPKGPPLIFTRKTPLRSIYKFVDGYPVRGKSWHCNGQKSSEGKFKDGSYDGLWTNWYESGQKRRELNYKDGQKHGLAAEWWPNGQKSAEQTYKDGKWHGLWTEWWPNGQKGSEGNCKDGKPDGLWTEWYEDGQKKLEENWKDGKDDGLWTEWYEDGQKKLESNYKDGKPDGLWTEWYKDGQKKLESNYKDGKLDVRNEWYENGRNSLVVSFREFRASASPMWKRFRDYLQGKVDLGGDVGEYRAKFAEVWKPNGEKCPKTNLMNGNGVVVLYYENGQKCSETNFKNGKLDGVVVWYHQNGQKKVEGNFKNGKLDGLRTRYHENGQKSSWTDYKNGMRGRTTNYKDGVPVVPVGKRRVTFPAK